MRSPGLAVFVLVASLILLSTPLMADKGKAKGKGNPHAEEAFDNEDRGWEQRGGYAYRVYGDRDGRPPGWNHGKKTGWDNCGFPHGQAKKYGCRTYVYQGRPNYYYQDDHGRIIVRRPIVQIHGGMDIY